jgi:UDP-sugar transporter A1/2/3
MVEPEISPTRLRFLRFITLVTLLFSDGTYSILRRYSRGVLHQTYSVNEVLLLGEVIKLAFSIYMMSSSSNQTSLDRLSLLLMNSKKMLILALIYLAGNVLSYFSLERVGAGTFVVIANLKTLTTAIFSTLMLGNQFSWTQWRALVLLITGVVIFVLPTLNDKDMEEDAETITDSSTSIESESAVILGVAAQLLTVTLSGYASIYFEKSIKHDPFDIWERNFQLGFYSILMYITLIYFEPGEIFENWTPLAFVVSCLGACGGLLVALSIKYGDSVLKTLAISGSVIYANVVDYIFLGGPMTMSMGLSAVVVVIAVLDYNWDATPSSPPSSKKSIGDGTHNDDNVEAEMIGLMKEERSGR